MLNNIYCISNERDFGGKRLHCSLYSYSFGEEKKGQKIALI